MRARFRLLAILALGASSASASDPSVTLLETPAVNGSGMYSLTVSPDGDAVFLSWVEQLGRDRHELRFAELEGGAWSEPGTIASGERWFVNWIDHPSVVALGDDRLAAHWLVHSRVQKGSYGYGIEIALSDDRGASWRSVFTAGMDHSDEYSGFVSMLPEEEGFSAIYLAPAPRGEHVMTVRAARFDAEGALVSDEELDSDACSCCTTAVAATIAGAVVLYRDHGQDELRDISVRLRRGNDWMDGGLVHADGWHVGACPTNGPALDAAGELVAASWFTAPNDERRVQVAFSVDGGASFGAPVRVDGGSPSGWAGVALLEDRSAVVSWVESHYGERSEVRLRRALRTGELSTPLVVSESPAGRDTGVPQLVAAGSRLVVAWRDGRVRTATVDPTSWTVSENPAVR